MIREKSNFRDVTLFDQRDVTCGKRKNSEYEQIMMIETYLAKKFCCENEIF